MSWPLFWTWWTQIALWVVLAYLLAGVVDQIVLNIMRRHDHAQQDSLRRWQESQPDEADNFLVFSSKDKD